MNNIVAPKELHSKFRLWILRGIVKLNNFESFFEDTRQEDSVYYFLQIQKNDDKNIVKEAIYKELEKAENSKIGSLRVLDININKIADVLNLNYTEQKILEFVLLIKNFDILNNGLSSIRQLNFLNISYVLSSILDLPLNQIKSALSPSSNLLNGYIFDRFLSVGSYSDIEGCFRLKDDSLLVSMLNPKSDLETIFSQVYKRCSQSNLNFSNFDYLDINEENFKEYISKSNTGTNILLYGLPGTGKTEFVKMLAKSINKNLFEVAYEEENRYSRTYLSGYERLSKLKVSNQILNQKDSLIMFDEVEDVFKDKEISKAHINRTLEENKIPTFWLTNDVYQIDDAYIRRFDMVIEFKIPPKAKRLEILTQYTNGQISEKVLKKISKNKFIAPALISNATKVVSNLNSDEKDKIFKDLIKNNLKAQGYRFDKKEKKKKEEKIDLPKSYDASIINSSLNLKELAEGIKSSKNARLCIYGPAGTGKSAYAKFIAKSLGSKIIIKKASDLMDAYVGETEKNIAKAFKEAKEKKAVLVFDEVDTFLQDRNEATRSWEVSQVNEMLTQMESFEGVFIATTNLIDRLDKASIRRFDMKIEFGYLKPKQAQKLFMKECEILGLEVSKTTKDRLLDFSILTPGDFAAALRANRFSPIKDADDFINRLNEEIKHKGVENSGNRVGF